MNTELQKCMDTDKDNHIIYFGEIVDARDDHTHGWHTS